MHEEVKLLLEGEIKRLRNLLEVHLRQHSEQLVPAIDDKKKKKKKHDFKDRKNCEDLCNST